MNRTDVMLTMIEMAQQGQALKPEDAIALVASMITRLEPLAPDFDTDMEALLGVGACIWQLQQE